VDTGLGDHPVGAAQAVQGDDGGLSLHRQPERSRSDVAEVDVSGAERLDLQRAVGELLDGRVEAVLGPQVLLLGDGHDGSPVAVGDETDRDGSAALTATTGVVAAGGEGDGAGGAETGDGEKGSTGEHDCSNAVHR